MRTPGPLVVLCALLAALALAGLGLGVWVLIRPPLAVALAPAPLPRRQRSVPQPTPSMLDSAAARAVARTPFRADRRPASVAYDPNAPALGGATPPPPPRPVLTLTGIAWGPEPEAVVEGLPGTDGPRLVRPGQEIGGVRVRRIERDRVTLAGFDTTWTLQVRTAWH